MEFTYDSTWLESKEARPLSLSLPLNFDGMPLRGDTVGFFFDNLLPDSEQIRRRVRSRFQTRSGDAFDLLAAIGRDCVGAIQLLPEDGTPQDAFTIAASPLDNEAIERALHGAVSTSNHTALDEDDDDFRISIAGAQEKTAFTWHRGRWCRPHGSTPSTHIFKLPSGLVGGRQLDMSQSLENEWLCSRLMSGYGVPTASCDFNVVARRCGLGADMESIIVDVIQATPAVIERVGGELPKKFSGELFEQITTNLAKATERLAALPSA